MARETAELLAELSEVKTGLQLMMDISLSV